MGFKYQISVIVCTYNPDWKKYEYTLRKFLQQKDISFEIIVSDDGSTEDYFCRVIRLFDRYHFKNCRFIKHTENVGTVKNYYGALLLCEGEYVFSLSPGDYVYADDTLKHFYDFAKQRNAQICFGNSVYYLPGEKIELLEGKYNDPSNIEIFADNYDLKKQKIGFFFGNAILGVSFLRRIDIALKYVGKLLNVSKYVEDNTSLAFYFADNNRLYHLNEYVSWYEYGTGVSTNQREIWNKRLTQDFDNTYRLLKENYHKDAIVDAVTIFRENKSKCVRALELLFKHPINFVQFLWIKYFVPKVQVNFQPINMDNFPKYVD